MGDTFSGNDGSVTFTAIGDDAAQAISFNMVDESPLVDVGVFNAGTKHDYENGRDDCKGTITVKPLHTATSLPAKGAAVVTLKSRSSAPYRQLTGSALLHRIPFARTRGDEPDTLEYAIAMTGSEWAFSNVPE